MCSYVYSYVGLRHKCLKNYLLLFIFKMPFYAVANGKVPGIYNSWEECQSQTKGFPQAKYKKFSTENEAKKFMETNTINSSNLLSIATAVENINLPELKPLGKYSSQTLLKQDKLSMLAEKLDQFMEQTNKKLDELAKRLDNFEACCAKGSSEGKRKNDQNSSSDEFSESKKKRLLETDSVDELGERRSTRNKSNSANGSVEEVDYPWRGNSNSSHDGFIIDPDGFTVVYTDGACSNNGKRGAKAGIGIWFNHEHPFNVAAPVQGNATNNNAEIQAATRAIHQAALAGIKRLNIHTDSQFMISCMTDWIKKWRKNNWMTSTGGPVKNKEQLVLLDKAINGMDAVKWTHVRGHMGNIGNECADALAVQGATMYQQL
ncbi:ribonuclease H1-like [Macrosteles quadrilineatus]|uniref:ribonuclease H1-like n=1 Tax=Macrosteles quadrilineatus TaxID=74068 RepID=UPI0023E233E6|nr:ribonuclease H1-like [Macrosteles quadrilineatus]